MEEKGESSHTAQKNVGERRFTLGQTEQKYKTVVIHKESGKVQINKSKTTHRILQQKK